MKGELNSSIRKNTRKIIWLTCPPIRTRCSLMKAAVAGCRRGDLHTEPWGRRLKELKTSSGERWPRRRCQNPRIDPTQEPLPRPHPVKIALESDRRFSPKNNRAEKTPPRLTEMAFSGGDDRTRTDNPLLAKQVLSQLSYVPKFQIVCSANSAKHPQYNTKISFAYLTYRIQWSRQDSNLGPRRYQRRALTN